MDSSDAGPLRLFNFGGAHAAGVLAMTALADFYNKYAAGRECRARVWAKQASVHSPEWGFGTHKAPLQKIIGGFVIRHSSFVIRRGFEAENFATRLTSSTHRPECQDVFPLPKPFRSLDRDSNRVQPAVGERT